MLYICVCFIISIVLYCCSYYTLTNAKSGIFIILILNKTSLRCIIIGVISIVRRFDLFGPFFLSSMRLFCYVDVYHLFVCPCAQMHLLSTRAAEDNAAADDSDSDGDDEKKEKKVEIGKIKRQTMCFTVTYMAL